MNGKGPSDIANRLPGWVLVKGLYEEVRREHGHIIPEGTFFLKRRKLYKEVNAIEY